LDAGIKDEEHRFSPLSKRGSVGRATWWIVNLSWLMLLSFAQHLDRQPMNGPFLTWTFVLTFWPVVAVNVKRWHDRGKPGWWCFLTFAPLIGIPLTIVELGFLGSTCDFSSPYYRGPRPYRERIRSQRGASWNS
jgi:uncharacterized membrane protein YhaH (DUF805 family)